LAQYYGFLATWEGVEDLPDDDVGEVDHMMMSMEIEEEYDTYFTEFGEVNGTQTVAILNDQSTWHAVTGEDIFKALLL